MSRGESYRDKIQLDDRTYPVSCLKKNIPADSSIKIDLTHCFGFYIYDPANSLFGDIRLKFGDTGDEIPFGCNVFMKTSGFRTLFVRNTTLIGMTLFIVISSDPNFIMAKLL